MALILLILCRKIEEICEPMRNTVKRDKEVNDELTDMGWLVLRFWESDIKKDLQRCVDLVCEYRGK